MPTELGFGKLTALVAAVGITLVILLAAPVPFPHGWDQAAHFAAFSALTFCLWQATGGSMPILVVGGVILFGALDEYRQAYLPERVSDAKDFLADLCAALATGALLFMQRKPGCAESSPR
jgi:VanZ family protein